MPSVTVVTATFGRGRHIAPTIRSVLDQHFTDFEYIVVGDGVTDDTESVVRSFCDPRIRWLPLEVNSGSQSIPNNAGIAASQGEIVAYIGHDDIWTPDHLAALTGLFAGRPDLDFAVSGCAFHGPPGSELAFITGFFDEGEAALEHFFPPSSFAHRRDVTDRIGPWRAAMEIADPVDVDLLLRAARAGMRFASTQRLTVHKFAAGHRYLAYLAQDSGEQEAMLAALAVPRAADQPDADAALVEQAKRAGTFMTMRYDPARSTKPGAAAEENRKNRGLSRPALLAIEGPVRIDQDNGARALDWLPLDPGETRIRWRHKNPNPKLLLPFTSEQPVTLRLQLAAKDPAFLDTVRLALNGEAIDFTRELPFRHGEAHEVTLVAAASLRPAAYSILQLSADAPMAEWGRDLGAAEIFLCSGDDAGDGAATFYAYMANLLSRLLEAEAAAAARGRTADAAWPALEAARRSAECERDSLRGHLAELRAEAEFLRESLAAMKRSASWKATAPMREMRRVLARLFRR